MNRTIRDTGLRLLAAFLAAVFFVIFVGSAFLTVAYLSDGVEDLRQGALRDCLRKDVSSVASYGYSFDIPTELIEEELLALYGDSAAHTNVRYIITLNDTVLFSDYRDEPYLTTYTASSIVSSAEMDAFRQHRVVGYVLEEMRAQDTYARIVSFWNGAERLCPFAAYIAIGSAVLCAAALLLYCRLAKRRSAGKPRLSERIPWDIYTAALLVFLTLAAGLATIVVDSVRYSSVSFYDNAAIYLFLAFTFACLLSLLLIAAVGSFIARCSRQGWIKNNIFHLLICYFRRKIPPVWRTALAAALLVVVDTFLLLLSWGTPSLQLLLVLCHLALAAWVIHDALERKRLRTAINEIAAGNLRYRVDTATLHGDAKKQGEALNRIGTVVSEAVDRQMRSERLKTDLITNVSHDLKTPLTSIINYTELLEKTQLDGEAGSYIEIISRNADRLKKLTTDLVEASKASSGSIPVQAEVLCLNELLEQAEAEYAEKFAAQALTLVSEVPEEKLEILSDGKCLWRILDNLLGNACKYSMSGTRVYLQVRAEPDAVTITLKNISRAELNISADELTERFVRGDRSRNTEGSGLGLSIAQSLTELLGGKLTLAIDGDLFKAELRLPKNTSPV